MIKPSALPLLLLPFAGGAVADTLYKCADESGTVLYTNQKAVGKSCTIVSRDQPVSTFSGPKPKPAATTPNDFPRVGNDQQRARDNDRRAILEQELATEQRALDDARKAATEQDGQIMPQERIAGGGINQGKVMERLQTYRDRVQLHERNIDALKKEISNLR